MDEDSFLSFLFLSDYGGGYASPRELRDVFTDLRHVSDLMRDRLSVSRADMVDGFFKALLDELSKDDGVARAFPTWQKNHAQAWMSYFLVRNFVIRTLPVYS